MYCKRIICMFLMMCIAVGLCGCANGINDESELTLGDIAYSALKSEKDYTIYIQEDGEDIPYLVLTNNYNGSGNTLLLRKYLMDEPQFYHNNNSSFPSYYPGSHIDTYLNTDFFASLSEIAQNSIIESEIEVTAECSFATSKENRKTETITRNIFLLSARELYYSDLGTRVSEGKTIKYFINNERRIATTSDGGVFFWYLRTPNIFHDDRTSGVYSHGVLGSAGVGISPATGEYETSYVRPAFCMKSTTTIQKNENKYYLRN